MFSLPEWAPNIHPLVVHFPIAILIIAVLGDLAALLLRRYDWLRPASLTLYGIGAIGALVAHQTGQDAGNGVTLPPEAYTMLNDHADAATMTLWFYSMFTVARVVVHRFAPLNRIPVHVLLFVIGAAGLSLVSQTAEKGAQLVYQQGVGVQNPGRTELPAPLDVPLRGGHGGKTADAGPHESKSAPSVGTEAEEQVRLQEHQPGSKHVLIQREAPDAAFRRNEKGGWRWNVGLGSEKVLIEEWELIEGEWEDLRPELVHDMAEGYVLQLAPMGGRVLLVVGAFIGSVQFDARLNLDNFRGTVALVHHVQDNSRFDFLEVGGNQLRLGRNAEGSTVVQDEGSASLTGWFSLRVVGDATHLRGYLDDQLVVHGHGTEARPGMVGLLIEGGGRLMVGGLEAQALR
jgi:uncharacterized membrane protein